LTEQIGGDFSLTLHAHGINRREQMISICYGLPSTHGRLSYKWKWAILEI